MEMKIYKILIMLMSLAFCENKDTYLYKIKFYGFEVAECYHNISDTLFNNQKAIHIKYKVKTTGLFNYIFNIDNNYSIVLDNESYQTLFYRKKTIQPRLNNEISTIFSNGVAKYSEDYIINKNEVNIFTILYLLSIDSVDIIKNFSILDREGKKYLFDIIAANENFYLINTNEIDSKDNGVIENTDIFTWGLFLPNSNKSIQINKENHLIEYCKFRKGILNITAELVQ